MTARITDRSATRGASPLTIEDAATPKTWSTMFPVHPAAAVFPMMSDDELDALGADIKANGLQHSIVLWSDNADTHLKSSAPYYILDGRNRLAAIDRAGIPVPEDWLGHRLEAVGPMVFARVCAWAWIAPGGKWEKTPGVDPAAFVIGANVHRRHLSKEKQADLIVKAVQAGEEFLAKLARNREAEDSKAGRPSDPVKSKAVQEGVKQGIGKRTIERSLARQEGRPTAPRKSRVSTVTPVPTIEPLNSAKAQTLLRQLESELYRLVERGQKAQRIVEGLGASPELIKELIDRGAKRENARIAKGRAA